MAQVGSDIHKGSTVYVEGVQEVIRKLRAAGKDLSEMRDLNHRLGNIVIANAQVPRQSGEVANTLRSGRGATKAVVRAGYANRGKYAGVLHYGSPHDGHKPHPFLTDALRRSQGQVISELFKGIDLIIKNNNLK